MILETRRIIFDKELNLEAYTFKGVKQKFPNHFHEYYVIGFIERGQRHLICKEKESIIKPGDLIIFNPRDNHTCSQIDNKTLDYRCINIQENIMKKTIFEITGQEFSPYFNQNIIFQSDLIDSFKELHDIIMKQEHDFKKEELFFFIIEQLLCEYTNPNLVLEAKESNLEINKICSFLEENFKNNISLNDLCEITGLSKYYLLHLFTKQKGISPYSYLENIRIGKAKKLLEQGTKPIEVALETGFSDQSHFSNFFKKYIGLTPKQYMNIFAK